MLKQGKGGRWITEVIRDFPTLSVFPPVAMSVFDEVFDLKNKDLKFAATFAAKKTPVLFDLVGL